MVLHIASFNYTGISSTTPICLLFDGYYNCVPLVWVTNKPIALMSRRGRMWSFSDRTVPSWANQSQVSPLQGHFPVCNENSAHCFQNGMSPWVPYSMFLKNSVPLKGWLEVLFDLSWRYPPGQDKNNVLGSPHWACPVILSPEGKVQLDLSVLATILDNVVIYGTKKKYEQLWYSHHCMFWLIACANSPYVLLT